MTIKIKQSNKYSKLVNFKNNHEEPIHRWFKIKEGYSKELIIGLIEDFGISDGYIVDFFNGSGTTALTAKEKGFKYYGFEINPFLHLLSKIKLSDFSREDIKKITRIKKNILSSYKKIRKVEQINLSILQKVFGKNLKDLLKIRTKILNIKEPFIRDFFIVALVSIIDDIGYAKKDGNGLKYPKTKQINNVADMFSDKIENMLKDINLSKIKPVKYSQIILGDSRNISSTLLNKIKNKTKMVVFSPPYANCFDYSEVYKLELWLSGFIKEYKDLILLRNSSLSSHLNKNLDMYVDHPYLEEDLRILSSKKMWSNKILKMLNGYFFDMEKVIQNSFDILDKGGICVIIVGNSAYAGHILKTDEILSKIGKKIGFKEVEINIARKLRASSQQTKLFKNGNSLRESVIVMKK